MNELPVMFPSWIPTIDGPGETRPCCLMWGANGEAVLPLFPSAEAAEELRNTGLAPSDVLETKVARVDDVFELAGLAWFVRASLGREVAFLANYVTRIKNDFVTREEVHEAEKLALEQPPELDAAACIALRMIAWSREGEVAPELKEGRFGLSMGAIRLPGGDVRENLIVRMQGTPHQMTALEERVIRQQVYRADGIREGSVVGPEEFGRSAGKLHAFHRIVGMGPRE